MVRKPNSEEFIEVKTSHSNEKTFTMSQNEIDFAKDNPTNYTLYVITNLGKDINAEYEVINQVYEKIEKKTFQSLSRKFKV